MCMIPSWRPARWVARVVYDLLPEQEFGLKHCGYYAQRAVRIEKFYAYWGQVGEYLVFYS